MDDLHESGRDFYLLPLQLDTDYQIRRHSAFRSMTDVMETVMESFARAAPSQASLVIKVHPLDNGLVDFRLQAARIAGQLGLSGRVEIIDGGHLPTLLARSRGVVVVNSTSGLSALHHSRPLKVLGRALFDMPGLTFQGGLDAFWEEGGQPDQELFRAFRKVVLRRAQVNGSFFTEEGLALAVEGALHRMGVATVVSLAQVVTRSELRQIELAAKSAVLVQQ
jgi:capsular polysaccharide export protein